LLLKATSGPVEVRGGALALGKRCNTTQTVEARNSETANIGQGGDEFTISICETTSLAAPAVLACHGTPRTWKAHV